MLRQCVSVVRSKSVKYKWDEMGWDGGTISGHSQILIFMDNSGFFMDILIFYILKWIFTDF